MAAHSSILTQSIPWTKELGGLQSIVSLGVKELDRTEATQHALKINVGWGSERDIEGDTDGCEILDGGKDRDIFKERITETHTNKGKKSGEREKRVGL